MNKVIKIPVKNLIYEITMCNRVTVDDLMIPMGTLVLLGSITFFVARYFIDGFFYKDMNELYAHILLLLPTLINFYLNLSVFNTMYVILKQKKGENLMILQMIDPKSFVNNK